MCYKILPIFLLLFAFACSDSESIQDENSLIDQLQSLDVIAGKAEYLNSPFSTSGNQLYVVGHQDGQFPDLGWHITGEMGGVWNHPIKLMDGYQLQIQLEGSNPICLAAANSFKNYPIGSSHTYELEEVGMQVTRMQFVPENMPGLIVGYRLANNSNEAKNAVVSFNGMSDLSPTWLGERSNMIDQEDEAEFNSELAAWEVKDTGNEWHLIFGSSNNAQAGETYTCPQERLGKGIDKTLTENMTIPAQASKEVYYFIAGSNKNKANAREHFNNLKQNHQALFDAKKSQFEDLANQAVLNIPDKKLEEAYLWTRYASEWLHFEVEGIASGIAAGIPDYPWWFGCDQTYSTRGLIHAGMPHIASSAMNSLLTLSEQANGNGQIVHEASTNGVVFNKGNINETPHFISTAWEYFQWTGDKVFLDQAYAVSKQGLSWLESQDKDQNGYPDGHGMMEIHGMDAEMMDVIAYTQEAYAAAAEMAAYYKDAELAQQYQEKANELARRINEEWWVANENSFADFRSDKAKAMELLEAALVRADTLDKPWSVADLKTAQERISASTENGLAPYAFYHNWVVNTPLELGIAEAEKAKKALTTAQRYVNPFGVYVTGIDRKKEESDPEAFAALKAKESFNYTGAVMTLPTGVQAIAAAQYGEMDQSLDYLQRMCRSFSYAVPGSLYEVSPDYGMLVQAWNIYAIAKPIVGFYFGIKPEAQNKAIRLKPHLPSSWNEASIKNLNIGDNVLSFSIQDGTYTIEQTQDWDIELILPDLEQVSVNGESRPLENGSISLKGNKIVVEGN